MWGRYSSVWAGRKSNESTRRFWIDMAATLAIIASIATIGTAGTTIGLDIAGAGKGGPQTPATPKPTPPDANALAQQKALVSRELPNVVGATSGLASPSYDALMAQILAGVLGQPGATAAGSSATGQQFQPANSQPTNAAVSGQPANLSDFINSFAG